MYQIYQLHIFCKITPTHISCYQLISIIDGGYSRLPLGDEGVVIGVVCNKQHFCKASQGDVLQLCLMQCCKIRLYLFANFMLLFTKQFRFPLRENLIEDVVIPLSLKLKGNSGLFKQICKGIYVT